jgi:transposase
MSEYRNAVRQYVDYLWSADLSWKCTKTNKITNEKYEDMMFWNREMGCYDLPSMLSTKNIPIETKLSARALKCASTQACGIVGAVVQKRNKDLRSSEWQRLNRGKVSPKLQKRIDLPLTKPDCAGISAELNTICAEIQDNSTSKTFNMWIKLGSFFKPEIFGKGFSISLPIKDHRQSLKWKKWQSKRMTSILLSENEVSIRFEVQTPILKTSGVTVGIDQGIDTCLTFSDGQTSKATYHGHSLKSIIKSMCRKRKGSKGFRRSQELRKNFVNYTVKRMNYGNIKQINLEGIVNLGFGKKAPRFLRSWTNTLIRDSIKKHSWEIGVQFIEVACSYNSQRCNVCGWTQKSNRKGKVFVCKSCGNTIDADLNASQNVEIREKLPNPTYEFREDRVSLKGFFWRLDGFFDSNGEVFTVSRPAISNIYQ